MDFFSSVAVRRSSTIARMSGSSVTRREFLQSTAVAGTGAAFAQFTPGLWGQVLPHADAASTATWASKAMRWAQLTLVEDDPAHFDAAFWIDYF